MSGFAGMAAAATAGLSLARAGRQVAAGAGGSFSDPTVLWLALGAALGVVYTLGTEKYLRVMQHRHLYVRMSMLFLAALVWLCAASALAVVCYNIYLQSRGLEGFERVLGALIPAVVRADLIVDWARRVSWALLNFRAWTGAMVQLQRVAARAPALPALTLSRDARGLVRAAAAAPADFAAAEDLMWAEDADALVRLQEIVKHFRKLARVSVFGSLAFVGAVPAAAVWVVYAPFKAMHSAQRGFGGYAALYLVSLLFAPLAALIVLIGSAALVVGVVTLSVVGTLIQFGVYWSTRVVYSMVRAALSEQWAGFPLGSDNRPKDADAAPPGPTAVRRPDEAGAAMARMGALIPTELEFALAPWDGSVNGDDKRADRVDRLSARVSVEGKARAADGLSAAENGGAPPPPPQRESRDSSATTVSRGRRGSEVAHAERERHLMLLARLGLDTATDTRRKRRLSTYYMLGMFVHMQVESGGKAWCLERVPEVGDAEFRDRLAGFGSFVALEAGDAAEELADRLRRMTKYRIVHSGSETEDLVTVRQWLRALVLFLLDTPWDSPGDKALDDWPMFPPPVKAGRAEAGAAKGDEWNDNKTDLYM